MASGDNDYATALAALDAIPPDIPRAEWLRVALAAKAAGLNEDDFIAWSERAPNFDSARDCRGAFRSDPTGISAGTLYYLARQHGWRHPRHNGTNGAHAQAHSGGFKSFAAAIWSMCEPATDHAYIVRKGGVSDGLRVYPPSAAPYKIAGEDVRGWLVVPAFAGAEIATLQFIAPEGGRKLNLPRHEVRGHFAVGEQQTGRVYVTEGIGHAWACWRATGRMSVCAFGASNMERVARSLAGRELVLVADRGKEKAVEAIAQAIGAGWVAMPADKPANYDANDYLAEHGAEALETLLEEVRRAKPAAGALPLLTLAELREQAQSVKWLCKGVVPAESLGLLFGASGAFKSFIALDLALHVAHGMPWLGRRTIKGQVIYIAAEGGAGLWRRIEAWHREHAIDWRVANIRVVPVPVDLLHDAARVRDAAKAACIDPVLIIVDTMSQTFPGEENSAGEVAAYLRQLGAEFRSEWHCAVLVVHHTGHAATERPRGSSALRANVDFMFGSFRDERQMLATLECHKQKDGEEFKAETFQLTVCALGRDEDGDPITSLVASRLPGTQATVNVMASEASRGRGGRNHLFLELAVNGIEEKRLRDNFYASLDETDPEARRKAYYRARKWALESGLIELAQGIVIRIERAAQ